MTSSDLESASRRRTKKRDEFLREMDAALPWDELVAVVSPHYYPGKRGRKPVGAERMLRMYFPQLWLNLSDEGVEDAVYDSRAFSGFNSKRTLQPGGDCRMTNNGEKSFVRTSSEFSPRCGENSISPNGDVPATADVLFESISQLIRGSHARASSKVNAEMTELYENEFAQTLS